MQAAEMEKATSQWCTSSERIFYASLFTPSINAHSVHSFFSTLYPSGNSLSQHFLPHSGHIVSFQSGSLGRGTFFLSGIIRIPLPSVSLFGSIFICIFYFLLSFVWAKMPYAYNPINVYLILLACACFRPFGVIHAFLAVVRMTRMQYDLSHIITLFRFP